MATARKAPTKGAGIDGIETQTGPDTAAEPMVGATPEHAGNSEHAKHAKHTENDAVQGPPQPVPLPARARLAALAGAGLGALSRVTGRGSGSVVGGHAILALDPKALSHFSAGRLVVLVSGTNGKTTTTKLLTAGLYAASGQEVLTNLAGANLPTGLVTALATGRPGAPAVLEVDEAWLARVAREVRPAALVLLNLSRDQLDRNNEVRQVAQRWREACEGLPPSTVVVANADDPLVAWAAMGARSVSWVGAGLVWRSDATGCPKCGGEVTFGGTQSPVMAREGSPALTERLSTCLTAQPPGYWQCPSCGLTRPPLGMWLEPAPGGGRAVCASGAVQELRLRLPGRCNQANAVMALAAVEALCPASDPAPRRAAPASDPGDPAPPAGSAAERALAAMQAVEEVAGRYTTIESAGTVARLLLAKNPAGWADVFDMLAPAPGPVVVAINAQTADGHDPSWLWDVPFERLQGRRVVATGERYLDLAVRLHYAGVAHDKELDLLRALAAAGPGKADVVANYTAFHQFLARAKRAGP